MPVLQKETGVGTAALFNNVLMSRTSCEQCGQDFLIVNEVPTRLDERDARPRE
jgi:hypothetical protein